MRADRLLSILLLLQTHQRMTARELAKRLEVSERTIHRDMEALGYAGIPVLAERGTGGGWMLLEEYRTNLTGLKEDEIQTLFLTQPVRLLSDLGLRKAAEAALVKLLAALPVIHRRDAEYVRQRIYIDVAGWHPTREEPVTFLPVLQEAIWKERKLRFAYQRGDECIERLADPLGLVAKGSGWYLVAMVDGQVRSYRVSRVRHAEVVDEPCVRPPDFDLAAFWAQSTAQFTATLPRFPVVICMPADMVHLLYHTGRRIERIGAPDEHGQVQAELVFENEEEACGFIISYGPAVAVIEPCALRERIFQLAERIVAAYSQYHQSEISVQGE
ncbi:MAG TPA: WYL domain-containing protein [Ktedonobacteraceae bacterium]